MITRDNINKVHTIYETHLPRWRYYYASFNGGFDYRKSSLEMLRRYLNEEVQPGSQYENRLMYTALENSCKLVVDTYRAFLFRALPSRTLGNLVNLPYVDDFMKDIDYDGTDIDQFMKEANSLAMIYGHVWVLVDKPAVGDSQLTLEQEIELDVRPYAQLVTPENVMDWEYERVLGRERLVYLKQKESEDEDTLIVKIWTTETISRYSLDKKKGNPKLISEVPNTINRIPMTMLKANRSHNKAYGISDLADVAKIQQAIFNLMSEAEQAIRISSHPSLVKTSSTDATGGAGAIINIDENMPGELKPYLLQPSAANIDSIIKLLKEHQAMIMTITHLAAINTVSTVAKSGVALQTEFTMLNTKLGDKADQLERLENQIWELFQIWSDFKADDTFLIEYKKKFDLRDEVTDLTNLKAVRDMNISSTTLNREIDKQISKIIIHNGDVLQDIVEEIDSSTVINTLET
jgi:hypothetical protein